MKTKKFAILDYFSDMDRVVSVRKIEGRMTMERFKKLFRYARMNSPQSSELRCHHEHDCCGCLCGQSMELEATHTGAKLILTRNFNY